MAETEKVAWHWDDTDTTLGQGDLVGIVISKPYPAFGSEPELTTEGRSTDGRNH